MTIRRRINPQIERHIEHSTPSAANQFSLNHRFNLEVHPTNSALTQAESHVCLNRCEVDSVLRKLRRAPRSKKSSSFICMRSRIDHPDPGDPSFLKLHVVYLS